MGQKTRVTVNIHMPVNNVPDLLKALDALDKRELLVGFPENKDVPRTSDDINNASIAYVMTKGNPAGNLPPRPFLAEGIREGKNPIIKELRNTADNAMEGNVAGVDKGFNAAGIVAVSAVRNKIVRGPFQALAKSTLRARRRRGRTGTRPLNDTGQMRNATNYTIRDKTK